MAKIHFCVINNIAQPKTFALHCIRNSKDVLFQIATFDLKIELFTVNGMQINIAAY